MPGLVVLIDSKESEFERNRNIVKKISQRSCFEHFHTSNYVEDLDFGLHASTVSFNEVPLTHAICREPFLCLLSGQLFLTGELKEFARKNKIDVNISEYGAKFVSILYQKGGVEALSLLNGSFTLLLVDKDNKSIILMNDRHGMHKWFYADLPNGSRLFAPDLISFREYPSISLTQDYSALIQKFKYDCILENRTHYNEVKRVPIATCFHYSSKTWRMAEYWAPESLEKKEKLDEKSFVENAANAFESITAEYVSNGNTGMSLTGGWDTRCIVAVLNKKGISMPSYTFKGCFQESFDVKIARKIAGVINWPHHNLVLGSDFLKNIDEWFVKAVVSSDGLSNLNTCHEYYLNILARRIANVRLTGKYGSQVIRGVTMLKDRSPSMEIFSSDFRARYNDEPEIQKTTSRSALIRWELPLLESVKQSQEHSVLQVRTPYMDNLLIDLMLQAPELSSKTILQKTIINNLNPTLSNMVTNRGEVANKKSEIPGIQTLFKTLNFLDMVYNWERLPKWARIGSYLFDSVGLSSLIIGKKEWIHYRRWIEKDLKDYVKSILLDDNTLNRSIFDRKYIKEMVKSHFNPIGNNYTCEIDKIIGFEMYQRNFHC